MPNSQIYPSVSYPGYGDIQTTPGSPSTTVVGLQTVPISTTAPTNGQVLELVSNVWTPTTLSSGPAFTTPGQGGFFGPGIPLLGPFYGQNVSSNIISGTINQISVFQFCLLASFTISKVTARSVNGVASATANFGIYSAAGALLLDSGALSLASANTTVTSSITAVALTPGTYYFAQSSNKTTAQTWGLQPGPATTAVDLINLNSVYIGQAANATSAGALPATLGTITADSVYPAVTIPFFQV